MLETLACLKICKIIFEHGQDNSKYVFGGYLMQLKYLGDILDILKCSEVFSGFQMGTGTLSDLCLSHKK